MSFLDKINAAKNPAAAAEKKVNPLLKQSAVVAAPTLVAAPVKAVSPAPAVSPLAKANPLLKPLATPAVSADATAVAAPKKTLTFPFKKKAETVDVAPAPTPEKIEVAPIAVEPPVEDFGAPAPDPIPVPVPAPDIAEEKKPATRRSSSRKKADVKEDGANATDLDVAGTGEEMPELPTTTMTFAAAAAVLTSPFADEVWDAFKVEIEEELNAIIIDQDMNPGVLKVVLSELNIVYDKIAQPLHESRTLLENLTNKDDGTIVVIKSISLGGSNDMERKRAGFLSAMNYKPKSGGNINLFEAAAEVRSRYNFLKGIYDRLKYKNDMLITMNGALKLEKDFIIRGDN